MESLPSDYAYGRVRHVDDYYFFDSNLLVNWPILKKLDNQKYTVKNGR